MFVFLYVALYFVSLLRYLYAVRCSIYFGQENLHNCKVIIAKCKFVNLSLPQLSLNQCMRIITYYVYSVLFIMINCSMFIQM